MITKEKERELMKLAIEASENSYSPYSNFQVGAAILTDEGEIFTGANIENASYGATICAERTAAVKSISSGSKHFVAIGIFGKNKIGETEDLSYPCGICRQFLNEFAVSDMVVLVGRSEEDYEKYLLSELLPKSFGPEKLNLSDKR